MKRAMTGGSHRGPVALGRQRRTLRFVQFLFVALGIVMLVLAIFPLRSGGTITRTAVLAFMGLGSVGVALLLQDGSGVRMPVPARLDELAGRAESVAVARVETAGSADPPSEV